MPVTFAPEAGWDNYTGCYTLHAATGDGAIMCLIPRATFAAGFHRPSLSLTDIEMLFRRNRRAFEVMFRQMIEAGGAAWWPNELAGDRQLQAVLTSARFAAFAKPEPATTLLSRSKAG